MKFTRLKKIDDLSEGVKHTGTVHSITKVKNRSYYDVEIKIQKKGIVSIWISDNVNPENPMFPVFDAYIENEEEAEAFDENEIVGSFINFTVKKLATKSKNGDETFRLFFDKVEPVVEEDNSNEK